MNQADNSITKASVSSNERKNIRMPYRKGYVIYAIIRNPSGEYWCKTVSRYENWGSEDRTAEDYIIPMTYQGRSLYIGIPPSDIVPPFDIYLFRQPGDEPRANDVLIGIGIEKDIG